jgi:hypothetical protein
LFRAFLGLSLVPRAWEGRNRYYELVNLLRFFLIVLYIGYLVNVGLIFIVVPWSQVWGLVLTMLPTELGAFFGLPAVRGALSAFGVLHLLLVLRELVQPTLLTPFRPPGSESQDVGGS